MIHTCPLSGQWEICKEHMKLGLKCVYFPLNIFFCLFCMVLCQNVWIILHIIIAYPCLSDESRYDVSNEKGKTFQEIHSPVLYLPTSQHVINHVSNKMPFHPGLLQSPSKGRNWVFPETPTVRQRQPRCCVLSCLIRSWDSLGKEEIRCQVRWR